MRLDGWFECSERLKRGRRQIEVDRGPRRTFDRIEFTRGHRLTIAQDVPTHPNVAEVAEPPPVRQHQVRPARTPALERQWREQASKVGEQRPHATIGTDDAVAAEVAVVDRFAEVTAIARAAVGQGQRVVAPLPDEPALQSMVCLKGLLICGVSTCGTHRVAVLAQDQRSAPVGGRFRPGDEVLDRGVHRTHDVGDGRVGIQVVHQRALVVKRATGIDATNPGSRRVVGGPVTRFVTERPGDHTRMIQIALHQSPDPLDDGVGVAVVVAQRGLTSMGFDVRLIDHVDPVLVAEVDKARIGGGMGATNGVDVVLLHQLEIPPHGGLVDAATPGRVELVTVHAVDHHGRAIDSQLVVGHHDRSKPGSLPAQVDHLAAGVAQRHHDVIEPR